MVMSRQFSSTHHDTERAIRNLVKTRRPSIQTPSTNSYEFEPFKFNIERQNMLYGYTMEELYGKCALLIFC